MKKQLAYIFIASIILFSFGMTLYVYWQQQTPTSNNNQAQIPQAYDAEPITTTAIFKLGTAELKTNQFNSIPIYMDTTNGKIGKFDVVISYDRDNADVTVEDGSLDNYLITEVDTAEKTIHISGEAKTGVEGNNILLGTIKVKPISGSNITFHFVNTAGHTDDSNAIPFGNAVVDVLGTTEDKTFPITKSTILSIDNQTLTVGQSKDVQVYLTTDRSPNGADIYIKYDPQFLDISNQIVSTDFAKSPFLEIDENAGRISASLISSNGISPTNGKINMFTLSVTPKKSGTTTLTIDFDSTNPNRIDKTSVYISTERILSNVQNGNFTIINSDGTETNTDGSTICYNTCSSTTECGANLTCQDVNGVQRCVNPSCSSNIDCNCSSSTLETGNNGSGGNQTTINRNQSNNKGSNRATINGNRSNNSNQALPQAGSTDITLILAMLSFITLGTGLFIKSRQY